MNSVRFSRQTKQHMFRKRAEQAEFSRFRTSAGEQSVSRQRQAGGRGSGDSAVQWPTVIGTSAFPRR